MRPTEDIFDFQNEKEEPTCLLLSRDVHALRNWTLRCGLSNSPNSQSR